MIERKQVEGRPALVAYLRDDFTPADSASATMVKILFDDGEVRFVRRELGAQSSRAMGALGA